MDKITNAYTNPRAPGAFSAVSGFIKNQKKLKPSNVKKTLNLQDALAVHKPYRKRFRRTPFIEFGVGHLWEARKMAFPVTAKQIETANVDAIRGASVNQYVFYGHRVPPMG